MQKIKCPKCGTEIEIGNDEYNALLSDIKSSEIDARVQERIRDIESKLKAEYELKANETKHNKDDEIQQLKNEINNLQGEISKNEANTKLAVSEATESLKNELNKKDQDILKLKGEAEVENKNHELSLKQLKEKYEFDLEAKDQEVKRWKEYRLGDSTKDLGESLEQYCSDMLEDLMPSTFPNAKFFKDNEVDETGKGDFIFRNYEDGIETVSIMIEMKNQNDTTKTKHKNEDFFPKLDKNRNSKNCEYAVLVSTLEEDSKLYNNGIVDVSHKYPKMFVVRPQYFTVIIRLLNTMGKNSFSYKQQLVEYQNEHIDVANFENAVKAVTEKIEKDYEYAANQYEDVEKMVDEMVKKLQAFKEAFRLGKKWIGAAQGQLTDLSIKKLTKDNPTMKARFDAIDNDNKDNQ